jgi:hypothetical protein
MLVTWTGGGVLNGQVEEATYTYLDANLKPVRVALWGNITAEFIFVGVAGDNTATVLDSPVAVPPPKGTVPKYGADLFEIYISSSSPTASMSIAEFSQAENSGDPMEPYTGNNTITINPGQGGDTETYGAGPGDVYIGARDFNPTEEAATTPPVDPVAAGVPLLQLTGITEQIGVRPPSADGTLNAGIVSAPGVSINRLFIGGTVTGRVDLGGSINTFYAGQILTGDADGLFVGETPDAPFDRNFNVAGDINNLISNQSIGTDKVASTDGKTNYVTGFRLSVGGHLGQLYSPNDVNASIYVQNSPTLKGLGLPQTAAYITGIAPPAKSGLTYFEGNMTAGDGSFGVPSLATGGSATDTFENNTPANAQFLATDFSSALGHNAIQVQGFVDSEAKINYDDAWYAVPLGADQTVTATLTVPVSALDLTDYSPLQLGIFSPSAGYETAEAPDNLSLLASTYNRLNPGVTFNQPITFTTTDAGVYYFAIGFYGDIDFNGVIPANGGTRLLDESKYQLDITGVKNLAVGGVSAGGSIDFTSGVLGPVGTFTGTTTTTTTTTNLPPSVQVDNGDLGAVISTGGGYILAGDNSSFGFVPSEISPIDAKNGNIRAIQAGDIGTVITGDELLGPDIRASGNVGVIRSTDSAGEMVFNSDIETVGSGTPIGGSYQLIDCAGLFQASPVADGNIGTINAKTVGNDLNVAPVIQVDANGKSHDGVIDLINVTGGNFGLLGVGGPQISTGPGGNVRYIHLAPGTEAFNDDFFGGLEDFPITYSAGQPATLVDDSGTPFTITDYAGGTVNYTPTTTTTAGTTTGATVTATATGDTMSILTYGIEGSGGVVPISVTCTAGDLSASTTTTGGTVVAGAGDGPTTVTVTGNANGTSGSVDLGELNLVGEGTALTFDPTTRAFTAGVAAGDTAGIPVDQSATLSGKSPVNVYSLDVTGVALSGGGGLAGATTIKNNTSGEIANFRANSVETLYAGALGTIHSDVNAPIDGSILADSLPFHDLRNIIQIGGSSTADGATGDPTVGAVGAAETIESSGAIGDLVTNGTIDNILADIGAKKITGTQEGITGVILAGSPGEFGTPGYSTESGNILNINIGDGLGYSGSGNAFNTGIFADNYIGTITNQNGSDIRGAINAGGDAGGLPVTVTIDPVTGKTVTNSVGNGQYLNQIDLTGGGSIIGAGIANYSGDFTGIAAGKIGVLGLLQTDFTGSYITSPNTVLSSDSAATLYATGSVDISGNGGIIGSLLAFGGLDTLDVGGFGVLNSDLATTSSNVFNAIDVGGYGIRSSIFTGANTVNSVDVSGNGKELSVTRFPSKVRQSETSGVTTDAWSGLPLSAFNDLDLNLGTSAKNSTRKGSTESGVLEDSVFDGQFKFGSLKAWRILGAGPATTSLSSITDTANGSSTLLLTNTLAKTLAQLINPVIPMEIDFPNAVGTISVTESTTNLGVTTGTLDGFSSGRNVVGSDFQVAGEIKRFTAGFINGSTHVSANGPDGLIDYLATTGNMNGNINASVGIGEIVAGQNLNSLNIDSAGNLDELLVDNNVQSKASIVVSKTLGKLIIKHNLLGGSTIQAGKIGSRNIGGVTNGNIFITGR